MNNVSNELCSNCLLWEGDALGEQGECLDANIQIAGRSPGCDRHLPRNIETNDLGMDHFDDFS